MFDRELMRQLATIPAEDRVGWIEERKKLEALAGEMTRLNVEEMIPKYGIARVLRAGASPDMIRAVLRKLEGCFDDYSVEEAAEIAKGV